MENDIKKNVFFFNSSQLALLAAINYFFIFFMPPLFEPTKGIFGYHRLPQLIINTLCGFQVTTCLPQVTTILRKSLIMCALGPFLQVTTIKQTFKSI